ncbi:granzyme A-like [Neolamprologus brichardi]|uniref:granzyme A-like n=1 Tax=Neolamprologus brichardi TaxID=32507 RepID=UPI0016437A9A|nr:granzyme A-like [Neolamprologus brichardi]
MLLKLSTPVRPSKTIQFIRLPRREMTLNENEKCRVAGWGKINTRGNVVDDLRVVDVSVISPQVCRERWGGLPPNIICAGGYNTTKGFCQGDSGGPLVCKGIAVGIVSFNKRLPGTELGDCNYPDIPNVYTDISKHLNWIRKILQGEKNAHIKARIAGMHNMLQKTLSLPSLPHFQPYCQGKDINGHIKKALPFKVMLLLQFAATRKEPGEPPGQNQQTERHLRSSGCQDAVRNSLHALPHTNSRPAFTSSL